jgi:hypothetical protein
VSEKDDEPVRAEVVDFDALNAALGAATDAPVPVIPESEGRSSATYASARPHAIPATRGPVAIPDEPAVIVQADDTVQSGPPNMTVPLGGPPPLRVPPVAVPIATPTVPTPAPAVFVRQSADEAKYTLPMPQRPRRPGGQTIVLTQAQGPTRQQKALVFIAMLVIVVSTGLAVLVYLHPNALDFGSHPVAPSPGR